MNYKHIKQITDCVAAIILLLLLSPLFAVLCLLLYIFQDGQVFFKQERVGLNKQKFRLYKFCSMYHKTNAKGDLLPDEQRVSPIGKIIRRYSLDELPQLINILKGDMSLVGPRPLLSTYAHRYTAFEDRRHEVKPGISGLVQVSGRNALSWEKRFELDVYYVDHLGFQTDARILCQTFVQIFRPKGVEHGNEHSIEPYDNYEL